MVYTFTRNAALAFKGDRKAARTLSGLVSHALGAGVLGLPVVDMLLATASAIGGSDDEPWDAEIALRNLLAKTFGKRHKNVLQAYDSLKCSSVFGRLNFQPSEYINEQGKTQRSVTMTKDGFTMLAMGFTGPNAMAFKEAYIAAFNAMAEQIASHQQNQWQMYRALIAIESESMVRTSFGSHLMIKRKREIPYFNRERDALAAQIQPSLFAN